MLYCIIRYWSKNVLNYLIQLAILSITYFFIYIFLFSSGLFFLIQLLSIIIIALSVGFQGLYFLYSFDKFRIKEYKVRLILGASSESLFFRVWVENFLIHLFSATIPLLLIEMLFSLVGECYLGSAISIDVDLHSSFWVLLFVTLLSVFNSILIYTYIGREEKH
ncbi:MAG: hypothetical protein OEW75_14045 [Cyclobacteriaceae bacterium]|nr:hypothetical protein [Cyclobacteriaceae bacterium]